MKYKYERKNWKCHHGLSPIPGTGSVIVTDSNTPMPIGYLWFRECLVNTMEILNVYTWEHARRAGVATKALEQLIQWFPQCEIYTESANKDSLAWLKKNGFVLEKRGWFKPARKPKK